MEQNSEDAQGTKRSAEIHSGEVKRVRVSSARAPRQAKLFCGISVSNFSSYSPILSVLFDDPEFFQDAREAAFGVAFKSVDRAI